MPPLIAAQVPLLPTSILAEADDATRELVAFDIEVGTVAAPFSAILLRSESASSSEIENLTASARVIAVAELSGRTTANSKVILGNVRAMEAAIALADDLSVSTVIAMQRALLGDTEPNQTGRFRQQQVWIGGGYSNSPHTASFVPPHHSRVPALMDDLIEFAKRADIPALPHIAIAHAQFETVHPFPDGNGRTGRALVQTMLRHHEVTRHVTVPVSAGLLHHTDQYFHALTAYRNGDLEPIVLAFAQASFSAVANGRRLVADLLAARDEWRTVTSTRTGSAGRRLLEQLTTHPVIDAATASRLLDVTPQNAQAGIDRLVGDGILIRIGTGGRNRLWQAADVLDALDRFAERARRNR
ncbi:MAG TPA: Fic family protein [Homoserinimonas sp.]|nr:Fic family protein [Homoserinimonas sp.]